MQAQQTCAMFTSNGTLMGVSRKTETVDAAIVLEQLGGGPFLWVAMQNCSGCCCGTWVAEDLQQQLLSPAVDSSSGPDAVIDIAMPVTDVFKRQYLRAVTASNSTAGIGRRQSGAAALSGSLD
jgi:hypothetical protein